MRNAWPPLSIYRFLCLLLIEYRLVIIACGVIFFTHFCFYEVDTVRSEDYPPKPAATYVHTSGGSHACRYINHCREMGLPFEE